MNQRGAGKLKILLGLIVVAALGLVAVRIVPVYVNAYQFRDAMRVQARTFPAAYPPTSVEDVRKDLLGLARELNLPIDTKNLQLSGVQRQSITIAVNFQVPVDLVVTTHTLRFNFRTDSAQAKEQQ